ncbi:DUF87 domain-containing protein [Helicobacter sp.]|uniref:helicase HerA domain-containing protein n=1 Tax=Helicobacter sp. TaxID=218 RepID=UPI0025865E1A|nr:DUF87 domain-containing protein [Helicobacter sp.]MCI7046505.1 DUF87 domain-containing protein [Helicobacter sp.]MCI7765869.1 DUF87 domain-containing protein [Helicobacter sp.]
MKKQLENLEVLNHKHNLYLNNQGLKLLQAKQIQANDIVLYQIEAITYKKDAPRKEALENIFGSLKIEGINVVYLILGDSSGVRFYYGIVRDNTKSAPKLDIDDIGRYILESSFKGNFRGAKITEVENQQKREILTSIMEQKYCSTLEGIPSCAKEESNKEEFQSIDRLVDIMLGDTFGLMVIASPLNLKQIDNIETELFALYDGLVKISKTQHQTSAGTNISEQVGTNTSTGTSKQIGTNIGTSQSAQIGTNESITKSSNSGTSESEAKGESLSSAKTTGKNSSVTSGTSKSEGGSSYNNGTNHQATEGTNNGETKTSGSSFTITKSSNKGTSESSSKGNSESTTKGSSEGRSESTTESNNKGSSESTTKGSNEGTADTIEIVNKRFQDIIKYIDEILLPRLDYGNAKGLFVASTLLFAQTPASLKRLENAAISLFGGEIGNKIPLQAFEITSKEQLESLKNFQLPNLGEELTHKTLHTALVCGQNDYMGNYISSKELALLAGLPKKDVVGLTLKEEVEFGLNLPEVEATKRIEVGRLIQGGRELSQKIYINKDELDKHIFVAGVTGSGKTTTCQNILHYANVPFLVIEPAKTEYRVLREKYDDLLIFTPGNDSVAPFRLNPFEFYEHENISSRVDMIMASIKAAFDMEAAIPQFIEAAIYECYKDYGWNIATNTNIKFEDPFRDGVYSFPMLSDLVRKIEKVVKEQNMGEKMQGEYIGSIRARLNGLLVGAKGFMLDTPRSIDFRDLLNKKVVLEIEEIRNGDEKSLIMGFVVGNLLEAIKARHKVDSSKGLKHILLIEEAHRLLSKVQAGDSGNKKQGVEVFADMLAEIRKYGECLIVADQIPNKLTQEVLKNTNTKIIHRLFAQDDKEAVGNTMALSDEQKEHLSMLGAGEVILFSGGYEKAVAAKIEQISDTTKQVEIVESMLEESALQFYADYASKGVIVGSQYLNSPSIKEIQNLLYARKNGILIEVIKDFKNTQKVKQALQNRLSALVEEVGINAVVCANLTKAIKKEILQDFIIQYCKDTIESSRRYHDEFFHLF